MYLGLDLGTSGVKAMLMDGDQKIVGSAMARSTSRGRIPAGRSRSRPTGSAPPRRPSPA